MRRDQIKPLPVPEEYDIPEETLLDVYFDATADYDDGETKSQEAQSNKEQLSEAINTLIESVREEGFRLGYKIGFMHGRDGIPDDDEDDPDDDLDALEADDADEEGWV